MTRKDDILLRKLFTRRAEGIDPEAGLYPQRYGTDTLPLLTGFNMEDSRLQRPPVPQRDVHDLVGSAMGRYVDGLEMRLVVHLHRHASLWHARESLRIAARWMSPGAKHPMVPWAEPHSILKEARAYATATLRNRLEGRVRKLQDIRLARYLHEPKKYHLAWRDAEGPALRATRAPKRRGPDQ